MPEDFKVTTQNGITRLTIFNPWEKARNVKVTYSLLESGKRFLKDILKKI